MRCMVSAGFDEVGHWRVGVAGSGCCVVRVWLGLMWGVLRSQESGRSEGILGDVGVGLKVAVGEGLGAVVWLRL